MADGQHRQHPFRFGIQHWTAASGAEWSEFARKAEGLGFSTLVMPDHLQFGLGPIAAMMAAADASTTLRVGTVVLAADFRNPAVLAKELATVDLLSGGRLEVGIGAGWMADDYAQSGLCLRPPAERIARLEEAVAVLRGAWSSESFDHSGRHFEIASLEGTPKPVQRPHPPIMIGGGGPKVLSLAARAADIVGINPTLPAGRIDERTPQDLTGGATDRKVGWVREAAGTRFPTLELAAQVIGGSTGATRAALEDHAAPFGLSMEDIAEIPHLWVGSVEEICDRLRERRERWGISYYVLENQSDLFLDGDAIEAMSEVVGRLAGT